MPIGCPKMSVNNHRQTSCKNPEERRHKLSIGAKIAGDVYSNLRAINSYSVLYYRKVCLLLFRRSLAVFFERMICVELQMKVISGFNEKISELKNRACLFLLHNFIYR